jgi:acetolactate synthase-1/2/3 large subunit
LVEMSGAKALLESLKKEKVTVVFGIPGGANLPIYDALVDSDIRHILCRHEQSAAHMADGFARASGRAGVCFATSGPGTTNLVTGIANAYMDSSPIIAVTGQVVTPFIGKDAFQETDTIGITTPITKYNFQPRKAAEIPSTIKKAFYIATTGRPGPVLVDIPKDVQSQTANVDFPEKIEIRGYKPNGVPEIESVRQSAKLLSEAKKPFILAGGGVKVSNAYQSLQKLSEFLLAPVGTTFMGKGCFPEDHPLSLGVVGMHGTPQANKIILETDVLFAIGVRFSDRTTGNIDEFCREAKVIHADVDAAEIGKNRIADVAIIGDADKTLQRLLESLRKKMSKRKRNDWFERIKHVREELKDNSETKETGLTPRPILKTLRRLLPRNAIVTTEVGQNQMWAGLFFESYLSRTFISSGGLGTMGFGFPASLGAKVAKPDVPVIDIAGDGSFMMTENSLGTSIVDKIPVTVIILNNSVLGMPAQWQRFFYNRRYSAVELRRIPDLVKLAQAYGAEGVRVGSTDEFERAVKTALKSEVTTVIDVPISPEEDVLPMVPPGNGLSSTVGVA